MLYSDGYLEIKKSSHVNRQRCSHTFLFAVGHYTYIQNLDFLFISILDQQDLAVCGEKIGWREWGWHWISTSSMREISWALWWISAACHFEKHPHSGGQLPTVLFFNLVATSSPFTPHCLHPLQNYCDRVNHNYQQPRPIITIPSHCANSNFKTGSPWVVV